MYQLITDINTLLNEEEQVMGSFVVTASKQTSKKLFDSHAHFKEYPTKRDENGNPSREVLYHVTISYQPVLSIAKVFQKYIGQKVKVKMSGLYQNDFIQAFYVKEMILENGERLQKKDSGPGQERGPAHMTISWEPGHKASEANTFLLQRQKSNPNPDRSIDEQFTGEFVFIPSKPKA